MKRSPMPAGAGFKPRTAPLKAASFKRIDAKESGTVAKLRAVKRKPKAKRRATAAERAHMAAVAAMGCVLCEHMGVGFMACEVHHVRVRHGWGRSGHMATVGLCPHHHRGEPGGVHSMGRKEFTAYYGVSELDLLVIVMRRLKKSESPIDCESTGPSVKQSLENNLSERILSESEGES